MGTHFLPAMITLSVPRDACRPGLSPGWHIHTPNLALKAQQPEQAVGAKASLHGDSKGPFHPGSASLGRSRVVDSSLFSQQGLAQRHTSLHHSTSPGSQSSLKNCYEGEEIHPCLAALPSTSGTAHGSCLPSARSQNSRRHPFGEKGHALVLYLVLVSEAPILPGSGL